MAGYSNQTGRRVNPGTNTNRSIVKSLTRRTLPRVGKNSVNWKMDYSRQEFPRLPIPELLTPDLTIVSETERVFMCSFI